MKSIRVYPLFLRGDITDIQDLDNLFHWPMNLVKNPTFWNRAFFNYRFLPPLIKEHSLSMWELKRKFQRNYKND